MAILTIMQSNEITREKYETLRAAVKWDKDFPAGLIYHACAFDEKGTMRVADVWESKEQLDTFFATRLVPELQKMKIQPPQGEIYPLYNLMAKPGAAQGTV